MFRPLNFYATVVGASCLSVLSLLQLQPQFQVSALPSTTSAASFVANSAPVFTYDLNATAARAVDSFLERQLPISFKNFFANIKACNDCHPGSVVASPWVHYFYHWTRDAGLVMTTVGKMYQRAQGDEAKKLEQTLWNYADFSNIIARVPNPSDAFDARLGEPKFYANGTGYWGEWGRPQNDGPALRALSLLRFINTYISRHGLEKALPLIRQKLYDNKLPTSTVLKMDLEYIAHKWHFPCFDLWEEIQGFHFYTRIVQRRALIEGGKFARMMGDSGAADFYEREAHYIEGAINHHWDSNRGYIVETFRSNPYSMPHKVSLLDLGTPLAALHADDPSFYPPTDDRILATSHRLRSEFAKLYTINREQSDLAPGIGRYIEDTYNGGDGLGGNANPWYLGTAAVAEVYYKAVTKYLSDGVITVSPVNVHFMRFYLPSAKPGNVYRAGTEEFSTLVSRILEDADSFLLRIQRHTPQDGSLNEQFDRNNGKPRGAVHLTWSYASLLTANWVRESLRAKMA